MSFKGFLKVTHDNPAYELSKVPEALDSLKSLTRPFGSHVPNANYFLSVVVFHPYATNGAWSAPTEVLAHSLSHDEVLLT